MCYLTVWCLTLVLKNQFNKSWIHFNVGTMLACFRWSSDCGRCILYRLTRPPLCGISPSTPVCSAASEDTGTTAWCYSPHGSPSLALHLQLCKLARDRRPPCVTHDCRPLTSTILIGLYESATSILARS